MNIDLTKNLSLILKHRWCTCTRVYQKRTSGMETRLYKSISILSSSSHLAFPKGTKDHIPVLTSRGQQAMSWLTLDCSQSQPASWSTVSQLKPVSQQTMTLSWHNCPKMGRIPFQEKKMLFNMPSSVLLHTRPVAKVIQMIFNWKYFHWNFSKTI